jgi:hypothetical protein
MPKYIIYLLFSFSSNINFFTLNKRNNAVSQQPVYNQEGAADQDFRYHNDWDSGLCGCFDNCGICCCVFFW